MIRKIFMLALCCALLACSIAYAGILKPSEDFYVLDDANVLERDTEGMIVFSNDLLYEDCGAQLVVVAAKNLDGMDTADYAYDLFNSWGIGRDGKGFLLLLAIEEDDYYYLAGEALDIEMSGGKVRVAIDDYLEPYFAKGEYDKGVDAVFRHLFEMMADACGSDVTVAEGIKAYESYLAADNSYDTYADDYVREYYEEDYYYEGEVSNRGPGFSSFWIIVIVIIVISVFSRKAPRSGRRGGGVFAPFIIFSRPRVHRRPPGNNGHAHRTPPRTTFGSRPSSGSRTTFGGSRNTGGSRSSGGFGGGRRGGGGSTRGGGGGRGR